MKVLKSWLNRWPEWGTIILLGASLGIAVGSVERVQWVTPSPPLMLVLALGVLAAYILHKSRLPLAIIHPLALLLGVIATVGFGATITLSAGGPSWFGRLAMVLQTWWQSMAEARGSTHFVAALVFLAWIMGYISAWSILRWKNIWVAVSLGTVTILINLNNLSEQYYPWFFVYALAMMALLGMSNLAKLHSWSARGGNRYSNAGMLLGVATALLLSALVVFAAWFAPAARADSLEKLAGAGTLWTKNIENYFDTLLSNVPAKQPFLRNDEQDTLLFGDSSFDQGSEPHFVIYSDHSGYLRTRMFDMYAAGGWTSSNLTDHPDRSEATGLERDASKRAILTYTVVPKLKTNILPSEGEFVSSDVPVSVLMLSAPRFHIDLINGGQESSLPPDVASLARSLRTAQAADGQMSLSEVRQSLPNDLALAEFRLSGADTNTPGQESIPLGAQVASIDVARVQPTTHDIVAVSSLYPLKPDRRYTVTASVSQTVPEDLSRSSDRYSRRTIDSYLQLPSSLPSRVRQVSRTLTRDASTAYDKAIAIQRYLSQFDYQLEAAAPPQGVDGVDYFIFSYKSGNCVQFASAMAVMLRSVGVPTRISIGYAPGEYQAGTHSALLTAKERHAWLEVYFPGYGWVEFDPTPSDGSRGTAASEEIVAANGASGIQEEEIIDDMSVGLFDASGSALSRRSGPSLTLLLFGGAAILLAFILVIATRRKIEDAPEVYRKMCFLASLLRIGPEAQQTPLEYCNTLASALPDHSEAISDIGQAYTERKYSRGGQLSPWERWRLRNSWRQVRQGLLKQLFHLKRLRPQSARYA